MIADQLIAICSSDFDYKRLKNKTLDGWETSLSTFLEQNKSYETVFDGEGADTIKFADLGLDTDRMCGVLSVDGSATDNWIAYCDGVDESKLSLSTWDGKSLYAGQVRTVTEWQTEFRDQKSSTVSAPSLAQDQKLKLVKQSQEKFARNNFLAEP